MTKMAWRPFLVISMAAVLGGSVFQNCAPNVNLAPMPVTYTSKMMSNFSAFVCPNFLAQPPANTKFLFMIDMSASNVGAFGPKPGLAGSYWLENGTDILGDRFAAIEQFMSHCANGNTNKFAFIGFAGTAGVLYTQDAKELLCQTEFAPAATALTSLHNLETAQSSFRNAMRRYLNTPYDGEPIPGIMQGGTSYDKALKCANSILTNDLTGNLAASNETYQFFFLSDGQPADGKGKGCNALPAGQVEACYKKQIREGVTYMDQLALAGQRDLHLSVVGYGAAGGASLATYLDYMAGEFDGSKASILSDFRNNPDAFCNLLAVRAQIEFRPDFAKAVNLTTLRKNGRWAADSDMDGLTDEEEATDPDHPDPQNPRSLVPGVLDGICKRLGGKVACLTKKQSLGACSATVDPNRLLSDCDVRMLGLPGKASGSTWGVDSDGDGIPDFVEIIKGLNPAAADTLSDPDNDGRSNLTEILEGSDPFVADNDLPATSLNSVYSRFVGSSPLDPSCTNGGDWQMSLERLFGVDTLTLSAAQAGLPGLAHNPGHQVAFLYFTQTPVNSGTLNDEYYFALSRFSILTSDVQKGNTIEHQVVVNPVDANPVPSSAFQKMSGP